MLLKVTNDVSALKPLIMFAEAIEKVQNFDRCQMCDILPQISTTFNSVVWNLFLNAPQEFAIEFNYSGFWNSGG